MLIVDEFTGRTMPGRRWSEGLHQAVEAKEGVTVKGETQTLATITIQNYFRMYEKLAGMTGTAETEETEFYSDLQARGRGHPDQPADASATTGTTSSTRRAARSTTRSSRRRSRLHELGLPGADRHDERRRVGDAVAHAQARAGCRTTCSTPSTTSARPRSSRGAGQPGAITIATNMAGRGTDIKLGPGVTESKPSMVKDLDGKDIDVVEAAACTSSASERHESRRIDRQLRGRSGRQGDPGVSQFFLSLEDDLMRLFGSERIARADGPDGRAGGRGAHAPAHHAVDRAGAEARRAPELPGAQAAARVRRRDEPAARGDLLAALVRARGRARSSRAKR